MTSLLMLCVIRVIMFFVKAISQKLLETQHKYKNRGLNVTVLEPGIEDDNGLSMAFGISLVGKDADYLKIVIPCLLNYLRQNGVEWTSTAYNKDQNCWVYTAKNGSGLLPKMMLSLVFNL